MKKFKKSLLLLLVLAMIMCSFASCGGEIGIGGGDVVMRYGDCVLTETDYAYLLSFIKGYYEYMFMNQYGSSFVMDDLMDMEMGNGQTLVEFLDSAVLEAAKMLLVVEQLCKENKLEITDADSLKEIETYMADLETNYGGRDAFAIQLAKLGYNATAVERYEKYNLYWKLLSDYYYGDNGVTPIARDEVVKVFNESYVKAEGYLYNFADSSYQSYVYDFASDYSEEEVKAFFEANYVIDYISFKDETIATQAYEALQAGGSMDDYVESCYKSAKGKFVSEHSLSQNLFEGLKGTEESSWYLSGNESGVYYLLYRHPISDELYTEELAKTVRSSMVVEAAFAYFLENYYTVRHILYSDKEKATQVYNDILAGKTTFAEHEKDTKDSGVQYTFTDGTMVEEFQEAAKTMEVGSYQLVETQHGWHLMTRLELDTVSGFNSSDAVAAMSREVLREDAKKQLAALKSGADFAKPGDGDLYVYSESTLLQLTNQLDSLQEAFKNAEVGEFFMLEAAGYGIFVLQKQATTETDLEKVYDDVENSLISEAYYNYIHTYFDAITVNQDVLGRFNVRTARALDDIFYY